MHMLARLPPTALAVCLLVTAAIAQTTPPTRVRGTIAAIDGPTMTVATREGPKVDVTLNDPLTVLTVKRVELASIASGTYVGIASRTGTNGELLAMSGERNPYPGKLGVIEQGALADLLLVDGDPIADIKLIEDPVKNLVVIMKDGKIYKNIL